MIPGLDALIGGALGGIFRLGQAFLEAREKQRDRDHEFRMTDLNGTLAEKADERKMKLVSLEGELKLQAEDLVAMREVSLAQASEAGKVGGFIAALSASVRPITTYWFLALYSVTKIALIIYAWGSGDAGLKAIIDAYTPNDQALFSSVITFWFVDRSLRKGRSNIAP